MTGEITMTVLRECWHRLWGAFRRNPPDHDLEREPRSHSTPSSRGGKRSSIEQPKNRVNFRALATVMVEYRPRTTSLTYACVRPIAAATVTWVTPAREIAVGYTIGWRRGTKNGQLSLSEHPRDNDTRERTTEFSNTRIVAASENTRMLAKRPGFVWKPTCAEPASRPSAPRSGGGAKRRALTPVSTRSRCWLDDAGGHHNILRSTGVQFRSDPRERQHPGEPLTMTSRRRAGPRPRP